MKALTKTTNTTICAPRHASLHAIYACMDKENRHNNMRIQACVHACQACMQARVKEGPRPIECGPEGRGSHKCVHACMNARMPWTRIAKTTMRASRHAHMHAMHACMHAWTRTTNTTICPSTQAHMHAMYAHMHAMRTWTRTTNITICASRHARMHTIYACMHA